MWTKCGFCTLKLFFQIYFDSGFLSLLLLRCIRYNQQKAILLILYVNVLLLYVCARIQFMYNIILSYRRSQNIYQRSIIIEITCIHKNIVTQLDDSKLYVLIFFRYSFWLIYVFFIFLFFFIYCIYSNVLDNMETILYTKYRSMRIQNYVSIKGNIIRESLSSMLSWFVQI